MRGEYDPNTYIRLVDPGTGRVTIADTEDETGVETTVANTAEQPIMPETQEELDVRVGEMRDRVHDNFEVTMTSPWRDVAHIDHGLDVHPDDLSDFSIQIDGLDQQAQESVNDWGSAAEVTVDGSLTDNQRVEQPNQPLPTFENDPHQLKLKSYIHESSLRRNQQALPEAEANLRQAEESAKIDQSAETLRALVEAQRAHSIIIANIRGSKGRLDRLHTQIAEREKADDFSITVDGVSTGSEERDQPQEVVSQPITVTENKRPEADGRLERLRAQLAESENELPQLRKQAQAALAEASDNMSARELWDLSNRAEEFSRTIDHISRLEKRIAGPDGETAKILSEDTQLIKDIRALRERGNTKHDQEDAEKRKGKPGEPQSVEELDSISQPDDVQLKLQDEERQHSIDQSRARLRQQYDELADSKSRVRSIIGDPDSNGFYLGNAFKKGQVLENYSSAINQVMVASQEIADRLGHGSQVEISDLEARMNFAVNRLDDVNDTMLRLGHEIMDAGQTDIRDSRVVDIGAGLVNVSRRNHEVITGIRSSGIQTGLST